MAKTVKHAFKEEDIIQSSDLKSGMVVRVHLKIKDVNTKGEEKQRIQVFEGTVIKTRSLKNDNGSFTVRKISGGIGVERIFPATMPAIEKITYVKQYRIRRAQAGFLREYKKKVKVVA